MLHMCIHLLTGHITTEIKELHRHTVEYVEHISSNKS